MILVDTNIILRLILDDSPILSPKARRIFEKITHSGVKTYLTLLTVSEVIFTLERSYKIPKTEIVKSLSQIFKIDDLTIERQDLVEQAFAYYVEKNINFPDAYQVAYMESKDLSQIYSFDEDFDKFPQINRLEK